MKKSVLLFCLLALVSCGGKVDTSGLNIVTPTGAPAFAFYRHVENAHFQTNSKPKNIVAMMTEQSDKDIVVIDTVSGIQAIQSGAPYLLASTITFGNFYLASTGNDENHVMDEEDKIVLFGQGQTPDKIFHFLYGDRFDAQIEYVTNVKDAQTCLESGKNLVTSSTVDYVFIAQPALFGALQNQTAATYGKAAIYQNIQEEYQAKTDGKAMMQASVFVKKTTDQKKISAFLKDLKTDITTLLDDPSVLEETIGAKDVEETVPLFGANYKVVQQVTKKNNGMGLGYQSAKEHKDAIDQFISLFGLEHTNEEIYF